MKRRYEEMDAEEDGGESGEVEDQEVVDPQNWQRMFQTFQLQYPFAPSPLLAHAPAPAVILVDSQMPTAIRPKPKRNCLHRGTNYVFPKRSQDVEDQTDDQQSEELSEPISSKRQLKRKSTYKKRTSRVTFTDEQNQLLLAVFNENPYPSIDQRNKLADENNLTESQAETQMLQLQQNNDEERVKEESVDQQVAEIVYTEEQTMSSQNVFSTSIARRTRKAPAPDASKGPNSKRRALADSSQSEPEVDLRESRHKRGSVRCVTYNDSDSDFDDSPVKRKSRNTRKNKADSKKDALHLLHPQNWSLTLMLRSHPVSTGNFSALRIEKSKEVVIKNRAVKKENDDLKTKMDEFKRANAKLKNGIRQMREEKEQLEVTLMDRVNKKIGDRNGCRKK
ncbi:hypothetical protein L3Y34_011485 [Caenorhabditis briggsae]|uniref:Homeobox domain-containing protein n=1 Tax=Caenorhabditis briggsae TaxID=6238 RepID=A0AAE8ZSX5_CAEBR|nr:hypothetical protein L3Y34_011485 [Caenorhabditis briggsae]